MNTPTTPVQNPAASPLLLTEPAAAAMLSITVRHLRTLRRRKLVSFVRLGRVVRFTPAAINAAVSKLTVNARAAS